MTEKRIISLILCVLIFTVSLPFASYAAGKKFRMVNTELPDISAELTGSVKSDDIDSAKLGSEKLKKVEAVSGDKATKAVFMLIDTSTSMDQYTLNCLKPSLKEYAQSLSKKTDRFVLMTFGESVRTLLDGGDSKSEIASAIDSITCNSGNTTFYNALNKVYSKAEKITGYDRKFVIAVTDGADLDTGNNSQQEVVDDFKTHRLPVYGLCPSYAAKSSMDGFGYIARNSGGELETFSSANASSQFSALKKTFNDVTVMKFTSKAKKSENSSKFTVTVNDTKYSLTIPVVAKEDTKAPTVKSVEYEKDTNSIVLNFSESVDNADDLSSFKVKKGGRELTVVSVEYKSNRAVLHMKEKIYSGKYSFDLSDITDASDNANPLKNSEFTEELDALPVILKILKIAGFVLIPVAFLAAIYCILLYMKKKKKVSKIRDIFIEQVEEEEHEAIHIKEKKGVQLRLCIDGADGTYHEITYNLISSLIAGRSDMCDLRIDDPRLSRQHFVIEKTPNGITVNDLGSVNGTFVNGVQIRSAVLLPSETRIFAGNTTIRVVYGG